MAISIITLTFFSPRPRPRYRFTRKGTCHRSGVTPTAPRNRFWNTCRPSPHCCVAKSRQQISDSECLRNGIHAPCSSIHSRLLLPSSTCPCSHHSVPLSSPCVLPSPFMLLSPLPLPLLTSSYFSVPLFLHPCRCGDSGQARVYLHRSLSSRLPKRR